MVFDSVRGRVALFGGGDITRVNDRWWEWDGSRWTRNDVGGPAPSPRFLMGLAHDLSRGRTVVQAGLPGMLSDTWERTTAGWTELTFPPSPGVRAYHALAYDVRRGRTVLFGGTDGLWMPLSDTWELEDPSCRFAGSGHAEARAPWAATSPPRIGTDFCLAFVTPGSGFLVLGTASLQPALPVSPPAFCSPGLLHTFPVVLFPIGAGGSVCLPVPDHQLLPGNRLYVQAGRVETGGCLRLTDALAVTLLP
jgi:hypothetical protein